MRFENSIWLWALLFLPLIYSFFSLELKRRKRSFERFASQKVWSSLVPQIHPQARFRKALIWTLGLGFLFLALARPKWGYHQERVSVSGMDVIFTLDVSNSMEVEDVVPSRIQRAKYFIRKVVENLGGDRVGLVAFAGSSYLASPLTTDRNYFLETLETLSPRVILNQGTDLGIALETAGNALERGAEDRDTARDTSGPPSKTVILISDGEDLEDKGAEGARKLGEIGAHLFVIGVGSEKGGPIPVRDPEGNSRGFKKEPNGETVISRFNSSSLQKIAEAGQGKYWSLSSGESEIQEVLSQLGALDRTDYSERTVTIYKERYQIPLALAILFLMIEVSWPSRRLAALFALVVFSSANRGLAQESLEVYLENKKGIRSFQDGKIDEAKRHFGSAQALNPEKSELLFNQGVVQLESGDYEGASRIFGSTALDSLQKKNPGIAGKSLYNMGTAFEKQQKKEQAIHAYSNAIRAAQESGDLELEANARKRIEMLYQEQQKKKQDGKEGDKKEEKKNDQGKDEQKEKKENQKSEEGQKKEDPKEYSQGKKDKKEKRKFESKKLSKEDAERVMAELSNREKQLQMRLKKQEGQKGAAKPTKDW